MKDYLFVFLIIAGCILLAFSIFASVVYIFIQLEESGQHPLHESTISIETIDGRYIYDTDGKAYVESIRWKYTRFDQILPSKENFKDSYNITYFCDNDNIRKFVSIIDISPTPKPTPKMPDPSKCILINGVCQ